MSAAAGTSVAATVCSQLFPSSLPPSFALPRSPIFRQRFLRVLLRNRSNACRRRSVEILRTSAAVPTAEAEKKQVLIVNTNSGGHAVIGFYFARELLGAGHEVTILTVGEEGSDKMKKPPFTRFSELVAAGGRTVWGDPAEVVTIVGSAAFDVVLDNNGKDLDAVKPIADWAKSAGVKQFLFISSAGIYKTSDEVPHVEGDSVKDDAGHVAVEKYIADLSFSSWAIFRPQYIIGSGNNKDYEEWFFDRIVRGRPVLIPESGMQLTNISHVRDLSSMLSLAVANPVSSSQKIFNCVSDRAVTFNGLVKLCAQAAGHEAKIVHYDPKSAGVDAKKAFPFRNMHFYAEPRGAKELLGWTSTTNLPKDLKERFDEYVSIGRDKKQLQFDIDDKILESLKQPVVVSTPAHLECTRGSLRGINITSTQPRTGGVSRRTAYVEKAEPKGSCRIDRTPGEVQGTILLLSDMVLPALRLGRPYTVQSRPLRDYLSGINGLTLELKPIPLK